MTSSIILSSLNSSLNTIQKNEILQMNSESEQYGLSLSQDDVEEIIKSRNHTLQSYGRIDLNINVTKQLIENLYISQYADKDDYVELINDLQDIFYYLKNETLDEISDIEILEIIDEFYNGCSGRIDNVQNKVEKFAQDYKWGKDRDK
jgi:hypothetical protein